MAAYHVKNKAARLAHAASYYARNRDAVLARSAAYYKANRESSMAVKAAWDAANRPKKNAHRALYDARKMSATPPWFERYLVDALYAKAREFAMEVDHVVPLQSDIVCGLHCWANLQLMTRSENAIKKNVVWPDMP